MLPISMKLRKKILFATLTVFLAAGIFAIPALAYINTSGWITDVKIKANSHDQSVLIRLKDANGNRVYPCGASYDWAYRGIIHSGGEGAVDRIVKLVISAKLANAKVSVATNIINNKCILEQITLVE